MGHDVKWSEIKAYVLEKYGEYETLIKDPNWKTIVEERQAAMVKDITDKVAANLVLEVAHTLLEDATMEFADSSKFGTDVEKKILGEKPGDFPGPDITSNPLGQPYWYEIKTLSGKKLKDMSVGSFTLTHASPEFEAMDEASKKYWGGMFKMAYKMRNLLFVQGTDVPKWPDKSRVGIKTASLFTQLKLDKLAEFLKEKKAVKVKVSKSPYGRADTGIMYNYSIEINVGGGDQILNIRDLYLSEFKFIDNFDAVETIRKAFFSALTRLGFTYSSGTWKKYVQ